MPTCSNCKTYFHTLVDEENMHSCPKCGFSLEENKCLLCGEELIPTMNGNLYCEDCEEIYLDDFLSGELRVFCYELSLTL